MPEHYNKPVKAPDAELKKEVLIKREYAVLTWQLDGKIDEVIQRLVDLKESTAEGCSLELSFEKVYGMWDEDTWNLALYDRRMETDQECRIRLQKEDERVESELARKRAQLEQLKKELGEG